MESHAFAIATDAENLLEHWYSYTSVIFYIVDNDSEQSFFVLKGKEQFVLSNCLSSLLSCLSACTG